MDVSIRTADIITILVYLLGLLGVGIYFSKRNKTTEDYFLGSRSFSGWVLGLSMLGTIVSSATFLALPAAAYILDWRQLTISLAVPFITVLAVLIFIPFFRRGKLISAFEYLGDRYGKVPRIYGTVSFIILQLIRMAQILFLVSLVIQFLTGAPISLVIIGTGIFIGIYTIMGGFEAVIWTDVLQSIILIVGGILCCIWVVVDLPGGLGQIFEVGSANNKFSLGEMNFDLGKRTFYTVAILGVINWLGIYAGDQNMVQRYASAKSTREAKKATIVYSAIAVPMWIMFFFIGTALFVYYEEFPNTVINSLEADQILPYFILSEIPPVITGIVISAVIAAGMSTMDSGINSISTVTVIDLMKPWLNKGKSDSFYLKSAHIIACMVTIIVISGAIVFSIMEKESMNDISLMVASIFGGCLMALFIMGFFTKRIDGFSATVALGVAVSLNIYLGLGVLEVLPDSITIPIHSYWVGAMVNGTFMIVAYGISSFRKNTYNDLSGLTVWTMKKN
ncbi:Sodium/glucose cotransporter [Arenibacter antarcticus]|uniref:Sodium/solute symporter n=1 Tax=Arenibacter antarcticus TaxID=2040469 RepID=A0ABW5VEP6_9FLAO|nr:sodium/solute symporter [Arenibacter sp. H213]MCM4167486.1 sodium:solute symporter [Arenibacter sp. H213]